MVVTRRLTRANWPGHRRRSWFSNRAFSLIVSVDASITLSMKFSSPSTTPVSASADEAVTGTFTRPMFCLIADRLEEGTENVTKIGSTCAIVASSVWLAVTRLPTLTGKFPRWPSMGDRMDVYASCSFELSTAACWATSCAFALSTAARSALTVAAIASAPARDCSATSLDTMPASASFAWRCAVSAEYSAFDPSRTSWASAWLSSAWSRRRLASAWRSEASNGRLSMVKSSWSFLTKSPSCTAIESIVPVICARTEIMVYASTLPMAAMSTGTSRATTLAVTTGTAPPSPPRPRPRPPPPPTRRPPSPNRRPRRQVRRD